MMTDKLFTKRLRDLTDNAIRESLAEISVEFEKRFGPAALTASPPVVEREAIARIIDPKEWELREQMLRYADEADYAHMVEQWTDQANEAVEISLAKADTILALTPVEGVGERSGFRTIGENWSTAGRLELPLAMGPRLSDAAKERLRKLEELDAIALMEACKYPLGGRFMYHDEEGEHDPAYVVIPGGEMLPINGYADGDTPIPTDVARAAFIVTACNAALSTPVAQGDEVRDALERIDKFVTDYLSPWGSWKTPWWEGEVSDEAAFSDDNALKHCANIARSALATLTKGARDAG